MSKWHDFLRFRIAQRVQTIGDRVVGQGDQGVNLSGDDLDRSWAFICGLPPSYFDANPAALEECYVVVSMAMAALGASRLREMHAPYIDVAAGHHLNCRFRRVAVLRKAEQVGQGVTLRIILREH